MTVASQSNLYSDLDVQFELDAALAQHTWFGIGGSADLLIRPNTLEALTTLTRRCRRDAVALRILGSGANLLVDVILLGIDEWLLPYSFELAVPTLGEIDAWEDTLS